jgi:hypothetical protein
MSSQRRTYGNPNLPTVKFYFYASSSRIKATTEEFKKNSKILIEMKKDLEYIFKKIRVLKTKLEQKYPEAFELALKSQATAENLDEEDEFEDKKTESKSDEKSTIDYVQMDQIKQDENQFQSRSNQENDSSDTS